MTELTRTLRQIPPARSAYYAVVAAIVFAGLYAARLYNYNLFHSASELFSVIVFFSIFVIAYNARNFLDNNYFLSLGAAYAFVACVDVLHTLAYSGMGVFPEFSANLPTQLWILGRGMQTAALLIAPYFAGDAFMRVRHHLLAWGSVTAIFLTTIFFVPVFPDAFVDGEGLTTFKIVAEYAISAGLIISLGLLYRIRAHFDTPALALISASVLVTIASELLFTLYTSPFGLANLVGHYLRIIAVFLAYKALVEAALVRPYTSLFRRLKQSELAERRGKERFRDIADYLQQALISSPPDVPGLSIGHLYRSATHGARVGGDLYDVFRVDDRRVGVVVGDVSGKGLPAATLTAVVKDTIRAYAYEDPSPASVLSKTNRAILRSSDDTSWVSVFFAVIDPATGSISYCTAGHPPPLLVAGEESGGDGGITPLEGRCPALGALPGRNYHEHTAELHPDDLLLLYTDGVIEARRDGDFYGEERLRTLARGLAGVPAGQVPSVIYDHVVRFADGHLNDDVAIVAVARSHHPAAAPSGAT